METEAQRSSVTNTVTGVIPVSYPKVTRLVSVRPVNIRPPAFKQCAGFGEPRVLLQSLVAYNKSLSLPSTGLLTPSPTRLIPNLLRSPLSGQRRHRFQGRELSALGWRVSHLLTGPEQGSSAQQTLVGSSSQPPTPPLPSRSLSPGPATQSAPPEPRAAYNSHALSGRVPNSASLCPPVPACASPLHWGSCLGPALGLA